MATTVVERHSVVDASADRVWQRIVTPEGINDEMRPWLTMSMPRGTTELTIDTIAVGTPVGRAWLRLFGVLPFDYDLLTLAEVEPGRRFLEESTMVSMSLWRHERTLTPVSDATTAVHDRITFQPRLPLRWATSVLAVVVGAFFGHRHRKLQRHFATT